MIRYKYHVDNVLAVVQEYLAGLILLSVFLMVIIKGIFQNPVILLFNILIAHRFRGGIFHDPVSFSPTRSSP